MLEWNTKAGMELKLMPGISRFEDFSQVKPSEAEGHGTLD